MAENNIAVQAASATDKLLLNGVEATAQQVYDAFMAGPIRLVNPKRENLVVIPYAMYWENSDGTQTNPKAVSFVDLAYSYLSDSDLVNTSISVGTEYTSVD